jgi:spermidine synthase
MPALLAAGFLSIFVQALLLRELAVAFYGVELIYTLALAFWLLWSGLGAWLHRKKSMPSWNQIGWLFAGTAVALVPGLAFIRALRMIFAPAPGAYLSFPLQLVSMSGCLLPFGLLAGLQFQWAAQRLTTGGSSLALAYAVESAGGLAGGLCSAWVIKAGLNSVSALLACAILALLGAIVCSSDRRSRCAFALLAVLLTSGFWMAAEWDRRMTRWNHPDLLETRDSPYGRITFTNLAGQISIFENDSLIYENEGTEAEELVHLATLQRPAPASILLLGGAVEGTVREAQKYHPAKLDCVELNPVLVNIAASHFPEMRDVLQLPNTRLFEADPRRYLSRASQYDLILSGMPEPSSGQSNRFYTVEFFRLCAAHLNPGGVFAFRLPSSENVWTPQLILRNTSIAAALKIAFPSFQFLPGTKNIVLASTAPLLQDPAALAERFAARTIHARLVSPGYIRYLYGNDRFRQVSAMLAGAGAEPNTDAKPVCYRYTVMLWLSKFFPSAGFSGGWNDPGTRALGLLLAALALGGLALASLATPATRRLFLAGSAGLAGMIAQTVAILHYQVTSGVLYQDIGLLLMCFMVGLSLGALAIDRITRDAEPRKAWGAGLLAGFAFTGVLLAGVTRAGASAGFWSSGFILVSTGALVSGLFSYASVCGNGIQARGAVARLYSADLLGGFLGCLAAVLFLIPGIGLTATALSLVPVALISSLLLRAGNR